MLISTDNGTARNLVGDIEAVRMIGEAGFNGIDFTFYDMTPDSDILALPEQKRYALAMKIREVAAKYNIAFPQSHTPYAYKFGEGKDSVHYQEVVKALQFSSWLGCPQSVIHTLKWPHGQKSEEEINDINREFLKSFLPYAEEYNVDIGVENLFIYDSKRACFFGQHDTPTKMNAFVDSLESNRFKVCCDLGHAALVGVEPEDFIAGMTSDRLTMLHVHDTSYKQDSHTIPYLGKQDWEKTTDAIAAIGFKGYMNLEVLHFYESFPVEMLPAAMRMARDSARFLADKVEAKLR